MNIDFMHNQIIRDTITKKFIESFNDNLVPYLSDEYGDSLDEIQLYEDYLTAGLRIGGEFFYPLTVVVDGKPTVRCVSWQVSNYRHYDKFNPFSYKGNEPLEFTLHDKLPDAVAAAVKGREIYAEGGISMPLLLTTASEDKTFLSGKYSQGFVDLLARSVTVLIEAELGIAALAESGVVLELRFAPGTFMEHIVGNTTYRRLTIKARGCAARDLWIKWTRLDGKGTYTISDNVKDSDVAFALAEDVPGKIKEKEYRYLTADGAEAYQAAMSRKNITEWREMMRRVIRRGEVIKLDVPPAARIASKPEEPAKAPEPAPVAAQTVPAREELAADEKGGRLALDDDIAALLRSAMGIAKPAPEPDERAEEVVDPTEEYEEVDYEEPTPEQDIDEPVRVAPSADAAVIDEERIRYEVEKRVRAEMEEEIKRRDAEAAELRAQLDARLRAEAREKELLAEAARAAVIEHQRLVKEREAEEAKAREEEALRAAERARQEAEEARERARLEEEARLKAEAEEKARREAEERAAEEERAKEVNYVSKTVKLFFKHQIDTDITKRIHEIILATIKYYHKEDVYIKIKANIPDITTVHLEFVKIPENEIPLLVNIIKVLGRSDLGIARAILD